MWLFHSVFSESGNEIAVDPLLRPAIKRLRIRFLFSPSIENYSVDTDPREKIPPPSRFSPRRWHGVNR